MPIANCKLEIINQKGFTPIEFFLIIGIIGILSSITVTGFRTYQPNMQLSETVRDLVSDLRYSQQLAVTEQIEHGIRFSVTESKYQIIKYGTPEEVIREKYLPEKVSFQAVSGLTNNEVKFIPYGAVRQPGTITLINTKNTTTTIDVRSSGFVKIIK